ncbi:MAG: MBL fold metallo-hydrolase [Clostridia bacterium]|nr:MBL fold metallo-hydrolase [Clostridia bacterium]
MKNKFLATLVAILFVGVGLVGGFGYYVFFYNAPTSDEYNPPKLKEEVVVNGDLEIHFMELGNIYTGDSIYIKCGENDILVDAGSRRDSATAIKNYVDQYCTDGTLEYVIATHADEDHISAFVSTQSRQGIFEYYAVETIIDFPKSDKDTDIYAKYQEARDLEVSENGAVHYTALECYNNEGGAKRVIPLSEDVELEILYNYYYEHDSDDENNYSVCFMINQGSNHYLFTGDLEKEGEAKLVDFYKPLGGLPKCILYKAGHHGSGTSSSPALMADIDPDYVVVCTCAGTSQYTDNNDTQFPTQEMINNIAPYTDKIYVTTMVDNYVDKADWKSSGTVKSMNGNIVFKVVDGVESISCSNNNTILKDTDWFKEHRTWPPIAA